MYITSMYLSACRWPLRRPLQLLRQYFELLITYYRTLPFFSNVSLTQRTSTLWVGMLLQHQLKLFSYHWLLAPRPHSTSLFSQVIVYAFPQWHEDGKGVLLHAKLYDEEIQRHPDLFPELKNLKPVSVLQAWLAAYGFKERSSK